MKFLYSLLTSPWLQAAWLVFIIVIAVLNIVGGHTLAAVLTVILLILALYNLGYSISRYATRHNKHTGELV